MIIEVLKFTILCGDSVMCRCNDIFDLGPPNYATMVCDVSQSRRWLQSPHSPNYPTTLKVIR